MSTAASTSTPYGCPNCTTAGSFKGDVARMPRTCPTRTNASIASDVSGYVDEDRQALMHAAEATPFKPDGALRTRVEELAHFARLRGMKRIGVAFCVSLLQESQRLAHLLQAEGLQTELVFRDASGVPAWSGQGGK